LVAWKELTSAVWKDVLLAAVKVGMKDFFSAESKAELKDFEKVEQ
jgi:hypothetical protein